MVEYRSSQFIRPTPWDIFPTWERYPREASSSMDSLHRNIHSGISRSFAVISRKTYRIPVYFTTAPPHRQ